MPRWGEQVPAFARTAHTEPLFIHLSRYRAVKIKWTQSARPRTKALSARKAGMLLGIVRCPGLVRPAARRGALPNFCAAQNFAPAVLHAVWQRRHPRNFHRSCAHGVVKPVLLADIGEGRLSSVLSSCFGQYAVARCAFPSTCILLSAVVLAAPCMRLDAFTTYDCCSLWHNCLGTA